MFLFPFIRSFYRTPNVKTTTTRQTTTVTNGVTTSTKTDSFVTTLRSRYGYNSVSTSTRVSTTTSKGNVWQAPPTTNNPEPPRTASVATNLTQRTRNSAMAYVESAPPRTTTTTTTTTTTITKRPVQPRWRLVPVGWGRWVWRRY